MLHNCLRSNTQVGVSPEHYMAFSSMSSLLTHTVAQSIRLFFIPKANNQSFKKFLNLAVSWVKVIKNDDQFLTTFTQLTARLKNFLRGWWLALGIKEGLVECGTVCVKSEVILAMDISIDGRRTLFQFSYIWNQ